MRLSFLKRPIFLIVCAGVIIVVLGFGLWWKLVYTSPQHVFEGMLVSNLRTSNVTKRQELSLSGSTVTQSVQVQTGNVNAARWLVTVKTAGSSVTTDSIGTPGRGYIRYASIKRDNGKDYHSVLNVWGTSQPNDGSSLNVLFQQSMLDIGTVPVPPIGSLTGDKRAELVKFIKNSAIFTTNFNKAKSVRVRGRPAYSYATTVQLAPYIQLMQAFAKDYKLTSLADADPSVYQNSVVTYTLVVDKASHRLVQVRYDKAHFKEDFLNYDLRQPIKLPTQTIPATTLEVRISKL